jgi:hypothetical protein
VAGHAIRRYRATGSTVLPPHGPASSADLAVEQAIIVYPDEVASVDADGLPDYPTPVTLRQARSRLRYGLTG